MRVSPVLLSRSILLVALLFLGFGFHASGADEGVDTRTPQQWWVQATSSRDAEESMSAYLRVATALPHDSLGSLARFQWLKGLYSLGRTQEARGGWEGWLADDPHIATDARLLYWFALTLLAEGETSEAMELLRTALSPQSVSQIDPYFHDMVAELLICGLRGMGETSAAIERATRFVRRSRSDDLLPLVLYDLALAYEEQGETKAASDTWRLLADSYPGTPEAAYAQECLETRFEEPAHEKSIENEPKTGEQYMLHLGSFTESTKAIDLHHKIEQRGLEVTVREIEAPSGPLFAILVGPFSTSRTAEAAKERLVTSLGITGILVLGPSSGH